MALIKPELTERDRWLKREKKRKRERKKTDTPINRDSRAVFVIQMFLKVSDICSLTSRICHFCVI